MQKRIPVYAFFFFFFQIALDLYFQTIKCKVCHRSLLSLQDSSEVAFENPWLTAGGEIIVVANSKSLLEREEVFAAVVAGGVTGGLLAATLSSVLIYKWHMKRDVSYILGRQKASQAY